MCYYCHTLKHNPGAKEHTSINCRDPKNSHSKHHKPEIKKMTSECYHCHTLGKKRHAPAHTTERCRDNKDAKSKSRTTTTQTELNQSTTIKWCTFCKKKTRHDLHSSNSLEPEWLRCVEC